MIAFRPLTTRLATLAAFSAAGLTFAFDLSQPLGVAGGMPYVLLPLVGLLARSARIVLATAAFGTVLTVIGLLLSPDGAQNNIVYTNRGMGIGLLWAVAFTALRHLQIGNSLRERLRQQAATDPLTGLYNRRYVFANIDDQLSRYERYGEVFSIILIDADHFKQINDRHGHGAGDATLRMVSDICRAAVRDIDVVGRFGGEEFIVVLPHTTAAEASVVAERIRKMLIEACRQPVAGAVPVTLSMGVAEVSVAASSFDDLLARADEALYEAKKAGRNRVVTIAGKSGHDRTADAA